MTRLEAERPILWKALGSLQIAEQDREDLIQEILIAAFLAEKAGRYRPDPVKDPRQNLQAWLRGIAWRQAAHHKERAFRRYEIPTADPIPAVETDHDDLEKRVVACFDLEKLEELPGTHKDILSAIGMGSSVKEFAEEHGANVHSAFSLLRRARRRLAKTI